MVIRNSAHACTAALLAALAGALIVAGMSGMVLAAVAGALALAAIAYRPELGALLFVCIVAALPHSLVFERGIPAFGGALKITDLILGVTLASWLAHAAIRRWDVAMPSRATTFLVPLGVTLAVLSIATAGGHGTPMKMSLFELRPLLSFLLVFPIVSGVRSLRDAELGLGLFLAAASVAGLLTIWRYAHGEGGIASYTNGQVRVNDSALLLSPLLAAIWVVVLAPTIRRPAILTLLAGVAIVSLGALFFTFQRTAWLAFFAAVTLLLVRLAPGMRLRLVMRGLPVVLAALIAVLAINSGATRSAHDPLRSGLTRLTSVTKFNKDVSGRYRIAEWKTAGRAIERHPLTGIGLGSTISFWSPMYSKATNTNGGIWTTYYIHNSYIWFALKIGLLGALAFVGLLLIQVVRARSLLREAKDVRQRRLILGALATLVALLLIAFAGPQLEADFATPYIAAVIALIEIAPLLTGERSVTHVSRTGTELGISAV